MEEKKSRKVAIDWKLVFARIKENKKLFLKVWVITFVLACVWILPQPRYYTAEVSVAPEAADAKDAGGLAALASNFGVNIGNGSADAIYPQLYPDLMGSTKFQVGLLDVRVRTLDGEVDTDYYTYLTQYQKENWLTWPFRKALRWVKGLFKEPEAELPGADGKRFDPFHLSFTTAEVLKGVSGNIGCLYSRTTDVVTISVRDQDPLVCAQMADSVKEHLQAYITDYRTKKARLDVEYYSRLTEEAKGEYERARKEYSRFADSYMNITRESYRAELDGLDNELQMKFSVYSAMSTRLDAAMAKVQENTPAFTTLNNATVPVKAAGPKRMIFVAAMLFLATCGTVLKLFKKELMEWF